MTKVFDASDYGAYGDGIHDDTAAIQAALDAAAASKGRVVLSAGTFLISFGTGSDCLVIPDDVALRGAGLGKTVLRLADGQRASGDLLQAADDGAVSRLTLDGNRENTTGTVNGFSASDLSWATLHFVEVRDASGYGLDLRYDGFASVQSCVLQGNGKDGIVANGVGSGSIEDTLALDNGGNGYNLAGRISLMDSEASGNGKNGAYLAAGVQGAEEDRELIVDGGSFHDNAEDGIHLQGLSGWEGYLVNGAEAFANAEEGIEVYDSQNGYLSYNSVHDNHTLGSGSEILLSGEPGEYDNYANHLNWNTITGAADGRTTAGITEIAGANNYNDVTDNVISQVDTPVVVTGDKSVFTRNQSFVRTVGTAAGDELTGSLARDDLHGEGGDDWLYGAGNDDILVGGRGRDHLSAGDGADVFRVEGLLDSYRNATHSHADRILDFDPAQDRLDLTAVGITGTGYGTGTTVRAIYDADRDLTYLKSLQPNAAGLRFELVLNGNLATSLSADNFQQLYDGADESDEMTGTAAAETFRGKLGNDRIDGGAGDDRLYGGRGADLLTGGAGADVFVYQNTNESLRSDIRYSSAHRDIIQDFASSGEDSIDVSALGFTGLGDGYGTTLTIGYNFIYRVTTLKSLEKNPWGDHFEIWLSGDKVDVLSAPTSIVFAPPDGDAPTSSLPDQDRTYRASASSPYADGGSGDDRVLGSAEDDWLSGGAGDDRLTGKAGADLLWGDSGADQFRFTAQADSQRSANGGSVDTIEDFTPTKDVIDLRGLDLSGFGDGHNGTLRVAYDAATDLTYLKDLDPDASGARFELKLLGDYRGELNGENVLFSEVA